MKWKDTTKSKQWDILAIVKAGKAYRATPVQPEKPHIFDLPGEHRNSIIWEAMPPGAPGAGRMMPLNAAELDP
ncbi:hypothetical protein AAE478_001961 [Parahypoxylon ruwenzoriense]